MIPIAAFAIACVGALCLLPLVIAATALVEYLRFRR